MPAKFEKQLLVSIPLSEILTNYIKQQGTPAEQRAWANKQRANLVRVVIETDDLVFYAQKEPGV